MVVSDRPGIQCLSERSSPDLIHTLQMCMTDKVEGDSIATSILQSQGYSREC